MKFNWGWRIAIVYSAFALSTIGFVAFAMSQKVELVRSDYYEHSLDHDKTRAAETRGNAVASAVTIDIDEDVLAVRLPADQIGAKGKVLLYRPDNSGMDKSFEIAETGISVPRAELIRGRYTVVLEWQYALQNYRIERQIEVGTI